MADYSLPQQPLTQQLSGYRVLYPNPGDCSVDFVPGGHHDAHLCITSGLQWNCLRHSDL